MRKVKERSRELITTTRQKHEMSEGKITRWQLHNKARSGEKSTRLMKERARDGITTTPQEHEMVVLWAITQ